MFFAVSILAANNKFPLIEALHKMITAAKEAVHAIKERDQLVTAAGGQQQQFAPDQLHPEGESSKLMENISAQEVGAP